MSELLIAGLGNPGPQYDNNRHNIGFRLVDELARRWGATAIREKWQAAHCEARRGGHRIHLIKPLGYMNRSGGPVGQFVRFYKSPLENLLVIHDDLDMAPARIKMTRGGGPGGHNGVRSIIAHLGTESFYRLKIGIGRPGTNGVHADFPVEKYVLSDFSQAEIGALRDRLDAIEAGLDKYVSGAPQQAMNILNALK